MQLAKRIAALSATGALLCGGLFATAASASAAAGDENSYAQARTVTTWIGGPMRSGPTTSSSVEQQVGANTTMTARCWVYGQNITRYGITNNVWIRVNSFDGGAPDYVWAGLLRGDRYANLPASNRC